MYTFTMVGCTLFKLCHCKCAKAYLLEILGMSRLWYDRMAHDRLNLKTKTVILKSQHNFLILSCLCCLQSLNLVGGSIFSKTRNYQKVGFPLEPDDVIVIPSTVHERKGKPRAIV